MESAPASLSVDARLSIAGVVLAVAGFLAMVSIGGAAAAYVFADRVALILAR